MPNQRMRDEMASEIRYPTRDGSPSRRTRGFTLVELLVVIVVIGILAAIAIPVFLSQADKASDTSLKSDLTNAAKLLQVAEANGETLPSEITAGQVVDLGSAGTFTSNQTLTIKGSGEALCVEGTSDSGATYSADLSEGVRDFNCAGIQSGALVTEGLVLHLDAADPKSYPGSGTTWFDLSGNGNHGTLINDIEYSSNGLGTLLIDHGEYVNIPYSSGFDFDYITFEYVVKPGQQVHVRPFVNRSTAGSGQVHPWRLTMADPAGSTFEFQALVNGEWQILESTTLFETDKFYHVAATYDGTIANLYVNGVVEDSLSVSGVIDKTTANIEIGRNNYYSPDRYAKQDSGTLRLYNRALTPSEIEQNFNATRERYGL